MNLIEAIKYLREDEDNRVICTDDNLYKFDGCDLCKNKSKPYSDGDWFKIHPYNTWTLDGKYEIYEEGKLYSFAEMMEHITSDKYAQFNVCFVSVDDPDTRVARYTKYDSIYFDEDYGDIPISCYLGKWRKIK
jgi:hypothetical protein